MRFSPRPLACLFALGIAGCGAEEPKEDVAARPSDASSSAGPAAAVAPVTVSHILIGIKGSGTRATRTSEQALTLAKSLIADLLAGRSMQELADKFSDDRDRNPKEAGGSPAHPYVVGIRGGQRYVEEFERAARETPVGKITPEPVKTQFGYHILRREK